MSRLTSKPKLAQILRCTAFFLHLPKGSTLTFFNPSYPTPAISLAWGVGAWKDEDSWLWSGAFCLHWLKISCLLPHFPSILLLHVGVGKNERQTVGMLPFSASKGQLSLILLGCSDPSQLSAWHCSKKR